VRLRTSSHLFDFGTTCRRSAHRAQQLAAGLILAQLGEFLFGLMPSASQLSRGFGMSSACRSVSLNALIRSGFGSSELRISLMTLSIEAGRSAGPQDMDAILDLLQPELRPAPRSTPNPIHSSRMSSAACSAGARRGRSSRLTGTLPSRLVFVSSDSRRTRRGRS
jgi:hypothetical protein